MLTIAIDAMIFAGATLMVYNIYGFVKFAGKVKSQRSWKSSTTILYVPVPLLVFFLMGYVFVGMFGNPDLMMGGILFFGSVFVFVVYRLLDSIIMQVVEGEQMESDLRAAEQSNRAKTKFMASVSHEMRTPLNVILGLDEVALMEPGISESMRDHLEKIRLSARHLTGLINNILELNRIQAGEQAIQREIFSLRENILQIGAVFGTMCEEKGLTYRVSGLDDLEPYYLGDGDLLKQVLISLIDNACKYTDAPGTVELIIHALPPEEGEQALRFTVKDTGIGMDQEFLEKAFDTFAQEDGSFTDRYGGSGLGLAVARQLVEMMGGRITAESRKGEGSTFTVALCLTPLGEDALPASEETQADESMLDSLTGVRILIVEDLPTNAEIVEDLLELEGAETEHAADGKIGLDMFAASAPGYYDAILMDLRMPVMDGLESTRRIRALDREDSGTIPIIALTANAAMEDMQNSLDAGMDVHLAKPADAGVLYDTLKRQIGRRRQ